MPVARAPVAALGVGLAGLVAVVAGTFLPWVTSGQVRRNLYVITAAVERLGVFGPGASWANWLALLAPVCILPVLLAVLRMYRTAAVLAVVIGVACGGFAATVIVLAAKRSVPGVSLALQGPVMVLAGAAATVGAAIAVLARGRRGAHAAAPRPFDENAAPAVLDPPH